MRKTLFIFCSVLSLFLLAVSASASQFPAPSSLFKPDEDGNTVLYIDTASDKWSDTKRDFLREWVDSEYKLISIDNTFVRFSILPPDHSFHQIDNSGGLWVNTPTDFARWLGVYHYTSALGTGTDIQVGPYHEQWFGSICPDFLKINFDLALHNFKDYVQYSGDLILKDTAGIFTPLIPLPPPLDPDPLPEPEPLPPVPPIDTGLIALQRPYVDAGFRLININMGKIINAAVIVMLFVAFLVLAFRIISELGGSA